MRKTITPTDCDAWAYWVERFRRVYLSGYSNLVLFQTRHESVHCLAQLLTSVLNQYCIDAGGQVTTDLTTDSELPCEDSIDSLSFMQGSVIGILVVFVFLCVAIIVILLRRRNRDAKREMDDSFQKHSRDDHLFDTVSAFSRFEILIFLNKNRRKRQSWQITSTSPRPNRAAIPAGQTLKQLNDSSFSMWARQMRQQYWGRWAHRSVQMVTILTRLCLLGVRRVRLDTLRDKKGFEKTTMYIRILYGRMVDKETDKPKKRK